MKKVIGQRVVPDVLEVCDNCEKEIGKLSTDALIEFNFGFGSNFDGDRGEVVFCSKCAEVLLEHLQTQFPNVNFIQHRDFDFYEESGS